MGSRVHKKPCITCLWAPIVAALLWSTPALSQDRMALLVGNGDYAVDELDLPNPANDVDALAPVLERNGFSVTTLTDGSGHDMRAAVTAFAEQAAGADTVLFFYAGHGLQVGDDNYFVGADFAGGGVAGVQNSALRMSNVLDAFSDVDSALKVLIIDACRDAPFAVQGQLRTGLRRSSGGTGTLIAYATDPGNIAFDGMGANSVFTAALLEHIETPGLDIRLMFGRVRQQVVLDSFGAQVPWVEEAVIGEHVLSVQPSEPGSITSRQADELLAWRDAEASGTPQSYRRFLARHPDGTFAELAAGRIATAERAVSPPDGDVVDLAGADPVSIMAALSTLGLAPGPQRAVSPETVAQAFARYRSQYSDPKAVGPVDLFRDAGQTAAFLAGSTAQRLRTDIAALRSVERTLAIAQDALAKIERIARTEPDAGPVLAQAVSDVASIQASRAAILDRLDLTRTYYAELVEDTAVYLTSDIRSNLFASATRSRSATIPAQRVLEGAAQFLDHVEIAQTRPKGSYQWLTEFLSAS